MPLAEAAARPEGDAAAARPEGEAAAARTEGEAAAARPEGAAAPNCSFFKKPAVKGKNIRKRTKEDDDEDEDQQGSAVVQKRKNLKKGRGTSRASAEEEPVRTGFVFESSRDVQTYSDSNATATVETETEFDKDARSLREKRLRNAADAVKRSEEDDGSASTRAGSGPSVYKGMNNYTDHLAGLRRENTISSEKAGGAHGPLRGSQHIRMSVRIDYQPDVCKDYKETGYCGYGDSCKFLHDRGDYKSGWQLEKDWEEQQKAKKERQRLGLSEDGDKDDDDDEELPFACFICREPFTDPVVTKCKHYYCEKCALKHYTKNKNCFVCNKPTFGIFNTAHDILKRARS